MVDVAWFGARLKRVRQTVHPADRGPYTLGELSENLRAQSGVTVTAAYLNQLENGRRDNPNLHLILALSRFFAVPVGAFFDDAEATRNEEERALLQLMRDTDLAPIATALLSMRPAARESARLILMEFARSHRS